MRQSIRRRLARLLPCLASLLVAIGTHAAPALAEPHPPELLRARVAEELVREGVSLAALERSLTVTTRGQGVVVSVIDKRSGRLVSERDVPQLPADREAAIAHLTMLVASMLQAEQLQARSAAPALLSGWRTAFVAQRIVAHHRPASIAVLAGGDPRGDGGAATLSAAEALAAAYREAGIGLVADGSSLGDLAALDDAAIVMRAASLPVDTIAVVRVFTGGPKLRAVVSLYDKAGALLTAYTATAGEAVRIPEQDAGPIQGVSNRTISAVLVESDRSGTALREYERRSVRSSLAAPGTAVFSPPLFYVGVGEERRVLTGADFYTAVGRDDLAGRYRARRKVAWTVTIAGGITAIGGLVLPFVWDGCSDDEFCIGPNPTAIKSGLIISTVGTIATGAGLLLLLWTDPLDDIERRKLVREHNRALRKRLGLPKEDERSGKAAPARATPSVAWAPFVTDGGGGIDVLVRF